MADDKPTGWHFTADDLKALGMALAMGTMIFQGCMASQSARQAATQSAETAAKVRAVGKDVREVQNHNRREMGLPPVKDE